MYPTVSLKQRWQPALQVRGTQRRKTQKYGKEQKRADDRSRMLIIILPTQQGAVAYAVFIFILCSTSLRVASVFFINFFQHMTQPQEEDWPRKLYIKGVLAL